MDGYLHNKGMDWKNTLFIIFFYRAAIRKRKHYLGYGTTIIVEKKKKMTQRQRKTNSYHVQAIGFRGNSKKGFMYFEVLQGKV